MTITHVRIDGLPTGVEVRRSTRRHKTVTAYRERGHTVLVVPHRMPIDQIRHHVTDLVARLDRRCVPPSDAMLGPRAEQLRAEYLPEVPAPTSVTWSTRQRRRWGSCTTVEGTIRVCHLLADMPEYVLDAILVHELAHLAIPNHDAAFNVLVGRFPHLELAESFLRGYEHARAGTQHAQAQGQQSAASTTGLA